MAKRILDLFVAGALLLLLSPAFLLIALWIKWDSPGPIFFRQERMGRGFRPFRIFKFRTMVVDAPKLGGQLTAGHGDPRITRAGRRLRNLKLDEMPQLLNVLAGHMSLVGPRPEVPRYVEMFRDDFAEILAVRPGITDPASLEYRDEATLLSASTDPEKTYIEEILPKKLALSKKYIARSSVLADLAMMGRTLLHFGR